MKKPEITLSINGKEIYPFEQIKLNQSINEHHSFEILVNHDVIESLGSHTLSKSKEWLGQQIIIKIGDAIFVGIITHVGLRQQGGYNGNIAISGFSKTILLENRPHMCSWLQSDLKNIVSKTVEKQGLESVVSPQFESDIEYMAQYKESHFQFVKRLAKQYNEWFYYDGTKLLFGKPPLPAAIPIEYGADMSSIDISIKAIPSIESRFTYNSLQHSEIESESAIAVGGLNELGNFASQVSNEIFSIPAKNHISNIVEDKSEVDMLAKGKKASMLANANVLSGTSTKLGLSVGSVIHVTAAQRKAGFFTTKDYGEYIITKITHESQGIDTYINHFEAIASSVHALPEPELKLPEATPQLATVVSNTDPSRKGRVQVRFQWQEGETTSWLQVMSPNAGSGLKNAPNRGQVFIPEVGDQVMVGFHYNDPSRPFVMGGLFNGTNTEGGREQNNFKSIITRSGHTIEFNDTERGESITITDKSHNIILIDTANKSIRISAPENISISAKNVDISASESLTVSAGKNMGINAGEGMNVGAGDDMTISSGDHLSIAAKTITEQASEDFVTFASNLEEHAETISKNSTQEGIDLNSAGTIKNNTGDKVNLF